MTDTTSDAMLLGCPFCGKAPKCATAYGEGTVAICFECPDGCAVSRDRPTYGEAVTVWNTRALATPPVLTGNAEP